MSEQEKYFYIAKKDGGWYIITEKKSYGPFEEKQDFALRKKGGSICFCVEEDGFDYVYTDGEKCGPYAFVESRAIVGEVDSFVYTWSALFFRFPLNKIGRKIWRQDLPSRFLNSLFSVSLKISFTSVRNTRSFRASSDSACQSRSRQVCSSWD